MQLGRFCCLLAIYPQQSASQWWLPSARTWCGPTTRPLQVRGFHLVARLFACFLCRRSSQASRSFSLLLLSDPFVKVYLLQDGRKISKKKTSTKRDDTNPIFNEAMIFSVPSIVLQVGHSVLRVFLCVCVLFYVCLKQTLYNSCKRASSSTACTCKSSS